MASGSKIVITYNTADGEVTHSYSHAIQNPSTGLVKALANATITNGSIFAKVPVSAKSAKIVTTSETSVDLG